MTLTLIIIMISIFVILTSFAFFYKFIIKELSSKDCDNYDQDGNKLNQR